MPLFGRNYLKRSRPTVKLTLATNVVSGWNQIDAVQLVGPISDATRHVIDI
jgi:hypothetical protein